MAEPGSREAAGIEGEPARLHDFSLKGTIRVAVPGSGGKKKAEKEKEKEKAEREGATPARTATALGAAADARAAFHRRARRPRAAAARWAAVPAASPPEEGVGELRRAERRGVGGLPELTGAASEFGAARREGQTLALDGDAVCFFWLSL